MTNKHLVKIVFLLVVLCNMQTLNAQSAQDRAKAYYFEAATAFEKRDYHKAVNYCQQIEEILGSSNARVEALRVKSYYNLGETTKAQQALKNFYTYPTDENLTQEVAQYIVKIEEKAEYERTHRTCWQCSGKGTYEEDITCSSCEGWGKEKYYPTCSECNGRGGRYINHGTAVGTKWHKCWACGGDGKAYEKYRDCSYCYGSGSSGTRTKTCTTCYGKGDVRR